MAKTKKKAVKSPKKSKSKNLVLYIEDSTMKGKLFTDIMKAQGFADKFKKDHPNPMNGYWVELIVSDIRGNITPEYDSPLEITYVP